MELSIQQSDVIDFVLHREGSANVVARAGTGKTTLLLAVVDALMQHRHGVEIFLGAYNKAIAQELQARLKTKGYDWRRAQASTLHSAGFSAWKRAAPDVKVDGDKVKDILVKMAIDEDAKDPVFSNMIRTHQTFLLQVVSYAKQAGFGFLADFESHDNWFSLIDHFGLDEMLEEKGGTMDMTRLIDTAMDTLELSKIQDRAVVDFNDMLLAPLIHNARMYPKDWVLIDEAQDTNAVRRALALKMLGKGGRLVAVGDPHQCHPKGTVIEVTGMGPVPIENLSKGQQVMTYTNGRFPGKISQGRKILRVAHRPYAGKIIRIFVVSGTEENLNQAVTPNHRCLVRLEKRNGYAVYLMQQGKKFRTGCCKIHYGGGFGPAMRARQEQAEKLWVLGYYNSFEEARLVELTQSYSYGIPQVLFRSSTERKVEGMSQARLDEFWLMFKDINPSSQVDPLLGDYGRQYDYPLWTKESTDHIGSKYSFVTQACNLQTGWFQVCVYGGDPSKPEWESTYIEDESYEGDVYSLEVEPNEAGRRLYIANNIVTHNSIYGFTGADSNAMDLIAKQLGSVTLPLTLTYRCPKLVVKLAQKWVPDIQAHETNPDGVVRTIRFSKPVPNPAHAETGTALEDPALDPEHRKHLEELLRKTRQMNDTPFWKTEQLRNDDAILCRYTAPLVDLAFRLIIDGIGCRVEGRDIGEDLIRLATRWKVDSLDDLLKRLEDYRLGETQKWLAKGKEEKADSIEDRVNTLSAIIGRLTAEGKHTVNALVEFIRNLFGDSEPGQRQDLLTLATVHRSKGREWNRVFLLGRNAYMPSKWARQPWQQQQERNLCYVAVTRVKKELVEINV